VGQDSRHLVFLRDTVIARWPLNTTLSVDMSSSHSTPLHMSSTSLSTKVPKSTISISLIIVSGERYVVRIETEHLPRHDTKDLDAFDIPAESLKAILWSRWQRDWGLRPPDPSRIKLVHFGRTINDSTVLRCTFHVFDSYTTLANRSIHSR
jgi:hypothetical protein